MSNEILVGLDLGSTKIRCLVAEPNAEGGLNLMGVGSAPATGVQNGLVTDLAGTAEAIQKAVKEAEIMSGQSVSSVILSLAGGTVKSFMAEGAIAVSGSTITKKDVDLAIKAANTALVANVPQGREVLSAKPLEYQVDDAPFSSAQPLGLKGARLAVKVLALTGSNEAISNLVNCVLQAGLNVIAVVLDSMATAEAVLTPEEKLSGVALLDIGQNFTDVTVYSEDQLRHTAVLSLGGKNLTYDLAQGLGLSSELAEKLKVGSDISDPDLSPLDRYVSLPPEEAAPPEKNNLSLVRQILADRVEEIFMVINQELTQRGLDERINGVVVTGGSSLLSDVPEISQKVLAKPVRRGEATRVSGLPEIALDPGYATAVGLCLLALNQGQSLSS
ncbi:MAG: cell division protein FtsA [Deltaproteobacteria bacterium]|jgi:cell division protein FtsA|nr:cell division protein FtsA [Deltaproteobacteria bacterium]